MGFFGQDYWSGLPCPPPVDLPDPGIEPESLGSPELAGAFFTTSATWKACIHPEKTTILKDICTPMFTAALFTIARTWKQPRCPSTDEWIKLWYMYTMEYYLAKKRNEFESVKVRWTNLEPLIQSEVSQKKKTSTVY